MAARRAAPSAMHERDLMYGEVLRLLQPRGATDHKITPRMLQAATHLMEDLHRAWQRHQHVQRQPLPAPLHSVWQIALRHAHIPLLQQLARVSGFHACVQGDSGMEALLTALRLPHAECREPLLRWLLRHVFPALLLPHQQALLLAAAVAAPTGACLAEWLLRLPHSTLRLLPRDAAEAAAAAEKKAHWSEVSVMEVPEHVLFPPCLEDVLEDCARHCPSVLPLLLRHPQVFPTPETLEEALEDLSPELLPRVMAAAKRHPPPLLDTGSR